MGRETVRVPRGQVYVLPERCKECGFCVQFCPEQVLSFSTGINAKGFHYPVVREDRAEACIDCGFCDLICPELAIYSREREPEPAAAEPSAPGEA